MKLSIIIPAHNEEGSIITALESISLALNAGNVDFELVVVNDHSSDLTGKLTRQWSPVNNRLMFVENDYSNGFGFAVRKGLDVFTGDAAVIVMADSSGHRQVL